MVKSNLPAHMDSVRSKLRPKHQLLILKCYPRLPKNSSADVKPNGSELSYLLFYATTRSSKLQKVGHFLERKTNSDVAHFQSARVTVTLQILTALLDKLSGTDGAFELIAPFVLRILLDVVVHTNDISLIDASRATWEAFCRHQSSATLTTDREYRECFEKVVEEYAHLATHNAIKKINRAAVPAHDATRLREIGLHAIQSVLATSGNLAIDANTRLLDLIVPAILSNLRCSDASHLEHLLRQRKIHAQEEKERMTAQRQSMNTIRTYTGISETLVESDPRAAEGTTQEADALAEEAVGLLALDCLKQLFASETRAQLQAATVAFLKFIGQSSQSQPQTSSPVNTFVSTQWATRVYELCMTWTPVQDRFVILVTTVNFISEFPVAQGHLQLHLQYVKLVDHVLRSSLNLIGLSVMDVLLALVRQILQVLQMSPTTAPALPSNGEGNGLNRVATTDLDTGASETRLELLVKLKASVANLATHVYYSDQISDMIAAILLRLKPNTSQSAQSPTSATIAAIQEPRDIIKEVAANVVHLTPRNNSVTAESAYFSFNLARRIALEAVRDIIAVANSSRSVSLGNAAENHTPVPIAVWEGTQWLLRDPSFEVRRAYVDALSTWLTNETTRSDARLPVSKQPRKVRSLNGSYGLAGALSRRAGSNASRREPVVPTSSFLPLLHLAIYENAQQYAGSSEVDILLLHALLTTSVHRLGINAVNAGLPMLLSIQDQGLKNNDGLVQVHLGTLIHGYLRTVVSCFGAEGKAVGKVVTDEIERRRSEKWWISRVEIIPVSPDAIRQSPSSHSAAPLNTEPRLASFNRREDLVDVIVEHYERHVAASNVSTPSSPVKASALDQDFDDATIKEPLLSAWSRESCLALMSDNVSKAQSLNGSKSSPPQFLAPQYSGQQSTVSNGNTNDVFSANSSSVPTYRQQAFAQLNSHSLDRQPSASTTGRDSIGSISGRGTVKVEELKRVLSNGGRLPRLEGGARYGSISDASSEDSLVEVDDAELDAESPYYRTPPQSAQAVDKGASTVIVPEIGDGPGDFLKVQPAKSLRSQGYSIATSKKKNVSILLGKIPVVESERRVVSMEQPPY